MAWHPKGKFLCAGDAEGNIRVLQADSCKQKHRMNTETSADSPTCIWSVAYLAYVFPPLSSSVDLLMDLTPEGG